MKSWIGYGENKYECASFEIVFRIRARRRRRLPGHRGAGRAHRRLRQGRPRAPGKTQSAIRANKVHTNAVPTGNDSSFYIGVNKSQLGQRYFMSAFMKQFFPGATDGGAGYPLGMKVVTFRVQNGKLFVFDASDLNKTSDQFDPTLIIESYPIVTDPTFANTPGNKNYVLFDPAAGMNKYGFVENMFDSNNFYGASTDFQVDARLLAELPGRQRRRHLGRGLHRLDEQRRPAQRRQPGLDLQGLGHPRPLAAQV